MYTKLRESSTKFAAGIIAYLHVWKEGHHDQSILTVFSCMRLDEESLYERFILMRLHKTYPAMSLNSSKIRSRRAEL